jgi:hypothetical protein
MATPRNVLEGLYREQLASEILRLSEEGSNRAAVFNLAGRRVASAEFVEPRSETFVQGESDMLVRIMPSSQGVLAKG